MPNAAMPVVVPLAELDSSRYEAAAQLLERVVQAGCQDANVLYMLAMAHKRQGKLNEARNALRKIQRPDANIILQMGLLSLQENQLAQAEDELARAWQMDPRSYEICYNLLLTRLTLGKLEDCLALIPNALELVLNREPTSREEERRFLLILADLLQACRKSDNGALPIAPLLTELTSGDEQ